MQSAPDRRAHREPSSAAPRPRRSAMHRPRRRLRRSLRLLHFLHLLPQTQRPHVGPHVLDVAKALALRTALANAFPARRIVAVRGPDGVLLLGIHDDLVAGVVLFIVPAHSAPSFTLSRGPTFVMAAGPAPPLLLGAHAPRNGSRLSLAAAPGSVCDVQLIIA